MRMVLGVAAFLALTFGAATTGEAQLGGKKKGDPRVEKLLRELDLKYTVDKDGDFRLEVAYDDGRSQVIFVSTATSDLDDLEIREVWSAGYKSEDEFSAEVANRLLEENAKYKLGGWQRSKISTGYLAVFTAKIAADCDAATMKTAIRVAGTAADEMEKELLGNDDL
jgi:hypothetical protein